MTTVPTPAIPTVASPPSTQGPATDASATDLDDPDTTETHSNDTTATDDTGCAPVDYPNDSADPTDDGAGSRRRFSPQRLAILIALITASALAALIGVLGTGEYHSRQSADLRAHYLQVARQAAVNLTTIDWRHADADVQRILGSATGTFFDDFSKRSQPFIDVVEKAQSTSNGTVTAAGLESSTDTDAQVLVAVSVQTATGGAPQQTARAWRMRISVHKAGSDIKVSNVRFVQ